MAIDDDLLKRRKAKRAQEDEQERKRTEKKQATDAAVGTKAAASDVMSPEPVIEKLEEQFRRAEVMIDQVNGIYLAYIRGVDTQSPLPRRQQLETLMTSLSNFPKPTPLYRFRFYNILSTFTQYKDRWDKLMKDLESGKIRRPPKMKGPLRRSG